VGFIYLGFYLHDKYRIEESLNIAVLKSLAYNESETDMVTGYVNYESYINQGIFYRFKKREEKEEQVGSYLYTCLGERLFIIKVGEITVEITGGELEITAEAYVNFPAFDGIFEGAFYLSFHRGEKNIISEREFVRMFDALGGVAEKVPGADYAIKMLQDVLETVK